MQPLIAISMGDPLGIGAEVLVKALAEDSLRARARWVVLGSAWAMEEASSSTGIAPMWHAFPADALGNSRVVPQREGEVVLLDVQQGGVVHGSSGPTSTCVSRAACTPQWAGAASYAFVERAIALAQLPADHPSHAHAVVTGPISKHHWALAGHARFPGHTELFAHTTGSDSYAMMFHAPAVARDAGQANVSASDVGLNVILTTVHRPLRSVADAITTQRVLEVVRLGAMQLRRMGVASPRVGVCGLNPHAGEKGLLGEEDENVIAPAIELARAEGILASGPHPADTIFQRALSRFVDGRLVAPEKFDLVVAMYHDQGLAALKSLAWDRAVNMTVGLPFLRTSPDHGTAFDIAGKNMADAGSMKAALRVAVDSVGVPGGGRGYSPASIQRGSDA